MRQTTIRVIFRMDRKAVPNPEVTAILPDLAANPGMFAMYAHIGQHGECSRDWYYNDTRPATPDEYKDLLSELTSVYGGKYAGDPDGIKLRTVSRIINERAKYRAAKVEIYASAGEWRIEE